MGGIWGIWGFNQSGKGVLANIIAQLQIKIYGKQNIFWVVKENPNISKNEVLPFSIDKEGNLTFQPIPNSIYIFDDFERIIDKRNWNTTYAKPIIAGMSKVMSACAKAPYDKQSIHYDVDIIIVNKPENLNNFFLSYMDIFIETDSRYEKSLKYYIQNKRKIKFKPIRISKRRYFADSERYLKKFKSLAMCY